MEAHDRQDQGVQARPFLPDTKANAPEVSEPVVEDIKAEPAVVQERRHLRFSTILRPLLYMLLHITILSVVAVALVLAMVMGQGGDVSQLDPQWMQLLERSDVQNQAAILMGIILIPIYVFVLYRGKRRDKRSLMMEPLRFSSFVGALILSVGALGATGLFMGGLEILSSYSPYVAEQLEVYEQLINGLLSTETDFYLSFFATAVVVPIAEELLFRGIVMGELRRAFSDTSSLILSSILFALFHMNFVQSSYVLIPGLALGLAYLMTQNLLVPIAMHGLFNYLGGVLPLQYESNETLSALIFGIEILVFALCVLGLVIRRCSGRRLYPKSE